MSSLVGRPVGSREAGLRVFVSGVEAVAVGVVEAHVHLGCVGRPEPGDELRSGAGGLLDLERSGERLPEVLDADGEATAEVAGVCEAGGARAGVGVDPGTLGAGALDDGESVGIGLDELEVVPDGVLGKGRAAGGARRFLRDAASAGLQRFRPEAAVGTCKADGAVHGLVAHGDVDLETEAADEVLLLVAVEDDGVDDADGGLAAEEVEAHGEGEPLALRHGTAVHAFDPDHGADWTLLFHGDALDLAEKFLACGRVLRIAGWPFLQDANQLARSSDHLAAEGDGVDEVGTGEWDGALHCSGFDASMNEDPLACLDGESPISRGHPSN